MVPKPLHIPLLSPGLDLLQGNWILKGSVEKGSGKVRKDIRERERRRQAAEENREKP